MSKRLRRRVAVTATVVAFALVVSGSRGVPDAGSAPAQSHCSRAAADPAILAGHFEAEPGATHPAAQVLCGVPVFGMVAGAWKYSKPQTKKSTSLLHVPYFKSPSGNIVCGLGDSGTAHCFSRNPPQSVTLRYDGAVTTCTGRGCFGNSSGPPLPVLGYGKRDGYARYRCTSATTGITCISLLRGKGYGKGFAISRDGVRRVAP